MKLNSHSVNKAGRIIVDSLLLMLFFSMLIAPVSTVSLLKFRTGVTSQAVLSGQDTRTNTFSPSAEIMPIIKDNFLPYVDEPTEESSMSMDSVEATPEEDVAVEESEELVNDNIVDEPKVAEEAEKVEETSETDVN